MSERRLAGRACHPFVWVCVVLMTLAGGCERTAITPQPQVQTAPADHPEPPVKEPPKPAASAPLLLEDEPASGASKEPAADNSRCFVCHANYMTEDLVTKHANANVSCVPCHGASDGHIADESWASGGNGTAPDRMYTKDKINSSCIACHPKEKIDTPPHMGILADLAGPKVCTDCHGNHRLPQRRCRWK